MEDITLRLVHALVVALLTRGQPLRLAFFSLFISFSVLKHCTKLPTRGLSIHTQFLLKQSWAQKKLSLMPSFKHVGHCRAPASLSQSAPRHFFLAGGSEVMVDD